MTTVPEHVDNRLAIKGLVRRARRTWFIAGVRRSDRNKLAQDLAAEMSGATDPVDVVGDDPLEMARDWADAQGVSDRRLRLALLLPATLLPGFIASGAVVATLYQAFTANGHTFLNRVSGPTRLAIYAGTACLAYFAMVVGAGVALSYVRDRTGRATVQSLARWLPVGAVLAVIDGVAVAAVRGYDSSRSSIEIIAASIIASLSVVIAAARWRVVRGRSSRLTGPSLTEAQ